MGKNICAESVEIALDLYKISKDFNIDLSITTSTDFFDFLFEIFAFNESSINDFNILFDALSHNVNNQVLIDSTKNAIASYLSNIDNIEIFDNLCSDLNGYLFSEFDGVKLDKIKLPKFRLSVFENSEIWEQLRMTQINDASHLQFESQLVCLNAVRMTKMGSSHVDNKQHLTVDDEEEKNNRRKYKYDQFIKFMLKDGGAEVIIDGANVGHMIKQDCFSFDL